MTRSVYTEYHMDEDQDKLNWTVDYIFGGVCLAVVLAILGVIVYYG